MIGKNKISGVVCEFNPLHNGHAALLSRISEEFGSNIVCVMSGNFVQRGEAAVLDKWSRTRLALQNGAALVLELPLPWAVAGAEKFALGGISLLNALGCVDTLTFAAKPAIPLPSCTARNTCTPMCLIRIFARRLQKAFRLQRRVRRL